MDILCNAISDRGGIARQYIRRQITLLKMQHRVAVRIFMRLLVIHDSFTEVKVNLDHSTVLST